MVIADSQQSQFRSCSNGVTDHAGYEIDDAFFQRPRLTIIIDEAYSAEHINDMVANMCMIRDFPTGWESNEVGSKWSIFE